MKIEKALTRILLQLQEVLSKINTEQYTTPIIVLNNATVGQHYRHLIDMFSCLSDGYGLGIVSYDGRKRDKSTEVDKAVAYALLTQLADQIKKADKEMKLMAAYDIDSAEEDIFNTTYYRELAYTLEHAVHHMALIKIGLKVSYPALPVAEDFGVASSTIKFRNACVR